MTKEIGDSLGRAAATEKLRGTAVSLTHNRGKSQGLEAETSSKKASRRPHTVYLPPALSKWVKMQAIEEDREISEIVTDALDIYRKLQG